MAILKQHYNNFVTHVTFTSPIAWAYDFGTVFWIDFAKKSAITGSLSASPAYMICEISEQNKNIDEQIEP